MRKTQQKMIKNRHNTKIVIATTQINMTSHETVGHKLLRAKLVSISVQCHNPERGYVSPYVEEHEISSKKLTPFQKSKSEIMGILKSARENIKKLREIPEKHAQTYASVEHRSEIRASLHRARKLRREIHLEKLKPEEEDQYRLIKKQIDECEDLLKHTTDTGAGVGPGHRTPASIHAGAQADDLFEGLEPIDDDLVAELQEIDEENARQDEDLDEIQLGLQRLRAIAMTMGNELDVQNAILDNTNTRVDDLTVTTRSLNRDITLFMRENQTKFWIYLILAVLLIFLITKIGDMITRN